MPLNHLDASRCYTAWGLADRMERIGYRRDLPQKYMGILQTSVYGFLPCDSSLNIQDYSNLVEGLRRSKAVWATFVVMQPMPETTVP